MFKCRCPGCESQFRAMFSLKQHITQVHLAHCRLCRRKLGDAMAKMSWVSDDTRNYVMDEKQAETWLNLSIMEAREASRKDIGEGEAEDRKGLEKEGNETVKEQKRKVTELSYDGIWIRLFPKRCSGETDGHGREPEDEEPEGKASSQAYDDRDNDSAEATTVIGLTAAYQNPYNISGPSGRARPLSHQERQQTLPQFPTRKPEEASDSGFWSSGAEEILPFVVCSAGTRL
ncbi:hypothetical protein MKZ38_002356 [Zalerion maritima]|uniref:C2H2-type domain-containing protein n=1 Tax=Zalerion maritima TaxID=339359 RepID=A0AAD5WUU1_9PEZI|nr:hypothetical protein MKZ38_002356 [Zalerion maritima]